MNYQITINEKAIGKERPRFNIYQKRTYTPQKTKKYEETIRNMFRQKYGLKTQPLENEAYVKIVVEYAPPKSLSKKKKQFLIDNKMGYTQKPDCDNIVKAILDALNGVAWKDDKQIVGLLVFKTYGEKDKIEIYIEEVEWI